MTDNNDIDELILRFSRRTPRNGDESRITLPSTLPHTAINVEPPPRSNLGTIGLLPVELLDLIFIHLDLRSLSRLASCSHLARNLVRSFPPYAQLLTHLYPSLVAMSDMRALHWYSVSDLVALFHAPACVSCGDHAPYLHLSLGHRICWFCMHENQAYWLLSLSKAKKLFGLKEHHLRHTHILRSLHGAKFIPPIRLGMRERLISGMAAKRAALALHGSPEALEQYVRSGTHPLIDKYLAIWICNAPLQPLGQNPSRLPVRRNRPASPDQYEGMGNLLLPTASLASGSLSAEAPYWCLGCQARLNDCPGPHPPLWLQGLARQARSRAEFAEHLEQCAGVARMRGLSSLEGDRYAPDYAGLRELVGNPVSAALFGEFGVGVAGAS